MNPVDMTRLQQAIARAAGDFADRRTCLFDVRVQSFDGRRAVLAGQVLDRHHLNTLRRTIAEEAPSLATDDSAIRILRTDAPPVMRTVATNLTDLHREPSFLSELMTQLLCGATVEVLDQRDRWCLVRQPGDGYLGWMYAPYLTDSAPPRFTHRVCAPSPAIDGEHTPEPLTRVLAGTPAEVVRTSGDRALVRFAGEMLPAGWIRQAFLRPLDSLPLPPAQARRQMIADARGFGGVYYLWGGGSAFGIDCSGLCQLVHHLAGYEIPRDADLQFAAGKPVEPPFQAGDLLFFGGQSSDKRKITHVGLALGEGWRMIHSSRSRNGVYEDDIQSVDHLRQSYAGARSFLT